MLKKKRLLFFINTLSGGGAEKVLVDLVNNLDESLYDITIHTLIDGGVFKSRLRNHIGYKSIVTTKNMFLIKFFSYLISFILSPRLIYSLFIKSDYDFEIAYLEGVPTKILSKSTNIKAKKYAWVHTDLRNSTGIKKVFPKHKLQTACYKKFDKIICVSNLSKTTFIEYLGISENVDVIYNVIDDNSIKGKAIEQINGYKFDDSFKIISVGRLIKEKGYDRLLKIVNTLNKEGFQFQLWIIGEGPERSNLENYIINNKLTNVELLGFKNNPYKYINVSDLFICSSRVEGYSTVISEAIILGKPIITTDCSGMKEMLGNSKFGLITDNNTDALYEGLKKLLVNRELYVQYKLKAKQRSIYYSITNNIKKYDALFYDERNQII
jgi:glycosyltransferase involved in cell wall biosynthesis